MARPTTSARSAVPHSDGELLLGLLERVASDLSVILGHEIALGEVAAERARSRPAGAGQVHISFKVGLRHESGALRHGCLLVPLPMAISWTAALLMLTEEEAAARRDESALDPSLKDGMLELGHVITNALSTALAELGQAGWSARSLGCQGVRADVRPAFPYEEGAELLVGRVRARFQGAAAQELLLLLPPT